MVKCKRTFFEKNLHAYSIGGANPGENWIKWKRDAFYTIRNPKSYEKDLGIYLYVSCENRERHYYPIKEKFFNQYFVFIEQVRDDKIESILS